MRGWSTMGCYLQKQLHPQSDCECIFGLVHCRLVTFVFLFSYQVPAPLSLPSLEQGMAFSQNLFPMNLADVTNVSVIGIFPDESHKGN
jgi:hypothetical protein